MATQEDSAIQLFETIALDNRLVTKYQLKKAHDELDKRGDAASPETLGDVFVSLEFINERQLESLQNALQYRSSRNEDKRLGRQLVRMRAVKSSIVQGGLQKQKSTYEKTGRTVRLADLLLKNGELEKADLKAARKELKRRAEIKASRRLAVTPTTADDFVRCPTCRAKLVIAPHNMGRTVKCSSCNHRFVATKGDDKGSEEAEVPIVAEVDDDEEVLDLDEIALEEDTDEESKPESDSTPDDELADLPDLGDDLDLDEIEEIDDAIPNTDDAIDDLDPLADVHADDELGDDDLDAIDDELADLDAVDLDADALKSENLDLDDEDDIDIEDLDDDELTDFDDPIDDDENLDDLVLRSDSAPGDDDFDPYDDLDDLDEIADEEISEVTSEDEIDSDELVEASEDEPAAAPAVGSDSGSGDEIDKAATAFLKPDSSLDMALDVEGDTDWAARAFDDRPIPARVPGEDDEDSDDGAAAGSVPAIPAGEVLDDDLPDLDHGSTRPAVASKSYGSLGDVKPDLAGAGAEGIEQELDEIGEVADLDDIDDLEDGELDDRQTPKGLPAELQKLSAMPVDRLADYEDLDRLVDDDGLERAEPAPSAPAARRELTPGQAPSAPRSISGRVTAPGVAVAERATLGREALTEAARAKAPGRVFTNAELERAWQDAVEAARRTWFESLELGD